MTRRPLLLPLALAGALILACGSGDKTPKPWSKREGEREVVVGNEGPGQSSAPRRADGQPLPASGTPDRGAIQQPNVQRIEPEAPANLPPVEERYDRLAAAGGIDACPPGTSKMSQQSRTREEYCVLEGTELRHGPYLSWWGNDQVHEVGPYVGGQRHGWWTEWYRDGKKAGTWRWNKGQPGSPEGAESP